MNFLILGLFFVMSVQILSEVGGMKNMSYKFNLIFLLFSVDVNRKEKN